MIAYKLKALAGADISNDRSTFTLRIETEQGPISLAMDRAQMEHFAMSMEGIEQRTFMLGRAEGAASSEGIEMRFLVADRHQVGVVNANGIPSVALVLKAGASIRAYALKQELAEDVARRITDELPKLNAVGSGKAS